MYALAAFILIMTQFSFFSDDPVKEVKEQAPAKQEVAFVSENFKRAEEEATIELVSSTRDEELVEYTVILNDTLMEIAFKLYKDMKRWREIAAANPGLDENYTIHVGQKIFVPSAEQPQMNIPRANRYTVLGGDTLWEISQKLYGSKRYWYSLWHSNKELIKDPNSLYAGFHLRYLPKKEMLKKISSHKKSYHRKNLQ